MKTLRATSRDKDGRDKYYDLQALRALDVEQGRDRLTGSELEAMIALCVARQLLMDVCDHLERFSKKHGAKAMLHCANGMLKKAIATMRDKISGEQLISISNNINDCGIIITSNYLGVKQMFNVDRDDLYHIINQAAKQCGLECSCTRQESKMCRLRYALDNIPGVKRMAKENWVTGDGCPYQIFEVDERDAE